MKYTPPEAKGHLAELRAALDASEAPKPKVTARTPGFVPQLPTYEELYPEPEETPDV